MADLNTLADAISKTLSPDAAQRKAAEAFLDQKAAARGFSVALLQLIALQSAPVHVRQATAVYMKNHTNKTYSNPEWRNMNPEDRIAVKGAIVDIMLTAPVTVRRQLSQVLAIVSEHEYPAEWPTLVPELSAKITAMLQPLSSLPAGQQVVNSIEWIKLQGVLETLHSIFARYPDCMRSDDLYIEINYSLRHTQEHLKALFEVMNKVIEDKVETQSPDLIKLFFDNVELLCKVFYCLSWQDFPAYFEDNRQEFMTNIRKLLIFESSVIDRIDEDELSPVHKVHAAIFEILNLYATKFDEDIRPYLQQFVSDAWGLLVRRSNAPKFDRVVTAGIKFLTSVTRSQDHELFKDPSTLAEVCKRIVIPNIELREEDVELFEDNPVEYIRRDMEGSDADTRRRGAVELVKGLCTQYETAVTEIFSSYVREMLSPQADWRKRDTAIYIVTALGWKSGTISGGATETSKLINVVDFFNNFIMPELNKCSATPTQLPTPIFAADLIKYVISFRNQISREGCANVIMACGKLLAAKEPVVKTYSAACIERILTVKDKVAQPNGNGAAPGSTLPKAVPRMPKSDLERILPTFLPTVLAVLKESSRPDEYVMRLILRFCTVARESMVTYLNNILRALAEILVAITTNPVNPVFNHFLFETISALIRFNANAGTVGKFEEILLTPLCNVLINDVSELAPYVFQVMSQLMMVHTDTVPATYGTLMQPILTPAMWERKGYIPGMVQYLEAYIMKSKANALTGNQLEQVLGVFQKLLASKATDHQALHLLTTIFEAMAVDELRQRLPVIMNVLMVRLTNAKTSKLVTNLICCLSTFVLRFGADALKASFDQVQANIFEMLLKQVWLPEVVTLRSSAQRRLCALALTDVACVSDVCTKQPYIALWPEILNVNVALTMGIVVDQKEEDEGKIEEGESFSLGSGELYSGAHSQLRWGAGNKKQAASLTEGRDPCAILGTNVKEFTNKHGAHFSSMFQEVVDAKAREAIASYSTRRP